MLLLLKLWLLLLQELWKKLQELQELLLGLRLATSSATAPTLLLLLPWLLALLLLVRASRSRSRCVPVFAKARLRHPGRRAVVGVEEDGVLEGAEARASLGLQSAVVTVPRGLRSRILERQVGSVSVRRAGRAPINRLGLQVGRARKKPS